MLQKRLGLSNDTVAFDVNLGCSGYVYGLYILTCILNSSETKYGLLLAGDTLAREKSQTRKVKTSHSASMLFGDCGTATLIEKSSDKCSLNYLLNTDGGGLKSIWTPYGCWRNPDVPHGETDGPYMDDIEVFNFATGTVVDQINKYMIMDNTTSEDYDALVLHQANMMIMKRIAKKTKFPLEKMLISIDTFGNTSSASIPVTLVKAYGECEDNRNIYALCCGFGVGLSWGTVGIHVNTSDIISLLHTDEFFRDGYNIEDKEENKND